MTNADVNHISELKGPKLLLNQSYGFDGSYSKSSGKPINYDEVCVQNL